jgi:hypothetical protein
MRKRAAKKYLGSDWHKLQFGRTLRPGDIVSTCKGYNDVVARVRPIWATGGRYANRLVADFQIDLVGCGTCSLVFCCAYPTETRDQIVAYWLAKDNPEYRTWYEQWTGGEKWEDSSWGRITRALQEGQEVFDERGLLLETRLTSSA